MGGTKEKEEQGEGIEEAEDGEEEYSSLIRQKDGINIDSIRCEKIQGRVNTYLESIIAKNNKNKKENTDVEDSNTNKDIDLTSIHTKSTSLLLRQYYALSLIVVGTILFFLVPLLVIFTDCNTDDDDD